MLNFVDESRFKGQGLPAEFLGLGLAAALGRESTAIHRKPSHWDDLVPSFCF